MFLFLVLFSFLSHPSYQNTLRYEDFVYDENIKTVRIFPVSDNPDIKMLPSVSQLDGSPLQLEFDDLQYDRVNYYAKIISCTYNWTKSNLHDLDFLDRYNEYNIDAYEYSSNTLQPYVHYKFIVPRVKVAGNYLLIVYKDGDINNLALSKRFMISSDQVLIKQEANYGISSFKATNQQINFTVNYNGVDIPNPLETVNVVIRQNQRWDNAQKDIKPSFVNESAKNLEYRFMNSNKNFLGGNEFRFVDFTSLRYPGQNTGRIVNNGSEINLDVALDAPRTSDRYAQYRDLNGGFIIANKDAGDGETTSNYLNVNFTLESPHSYNSDVYVIGSFNNWKLDPSNKMNYKDGYYTSTILLKQGFYNYQYLATNNSESIEGNFFETENFYEIFVYNKSYFPNADLLMGYYTFVVNQR